VISIRKRGVVSLLVDDIGDVLELAGRVFERAATFARCRALLPSAGDES